MIKGVIFDMDGLLLDSERLYFEAYQETRQALGLVPDDDLFLRMVGTNVTLSRTLLAEGLAGLVAMDAFEAHWASACAKRVAAGIPLKSGVRDLLEQLRDTPKAIATSTKTEKALAHLSEAGLGHFFPILIGGDQVNKSKPEPEIYLKACEALGLTPDQCVAFEDSENGVRAALSAGLTTVQIPDLVVPTPAFAASGQIIAEDLIAGARAVGLIP